jgi:small subunit ribosomal protein S2
MNDLPGVVFVVDVHREVNALREARKLGIPTVALIDTDSDPDLVDIPIPGNDDAMRAIELIVGELAEAIGPAKAQRTDKGEEAAAAAPRRRSQRPVMARADAEAPTSPSDQSPAAADEPAAPPSPPGPEQPDPDAPASA